MFRPFKCSWSHVLEVDVVVLTVMTELFIKGNSRFAAAVLHCWRQYVLGTSGAVVLVNILFSCCFSSF